MSAFVLDADHIDLLVTVAMKVPGFNEKYVNIPETADRLGQDLWNENYASVNYRYDEEEPVPEYHWTPVAEIQSEKLGPGHLLQVLKAAHCYGYQTCEHPAWTDSRAFWVTQAIEQWAERGLLARRWPKDAGYEGNDYRGEDKVAWEWHRENGFPVIERAA